MLLRRCSNILIGSFCCIFVLMTTQRIKMISASSIAVPPPTYVTTISNADNSTDSIQSSSSLFSTELSYAEYEDDLNDLDEFDDEQNHEWDLLIFTQSWPATTCYEWEEKDKTHECMLPKQKEFWTIHGIWPTKLGQLGPMFCNKTASFEPDQLQQIMTELLEYWPDMFRESDGNWLWKHEWLKHGTCAMLLDKLSSELKYFRQGLDWREKYILKNILGSAGIHPDSNNTVVALQTALVAQLGKNPSIHCLWDSKNDVSYLAEIRMCFNKTLQLTDCDGVKPGDAMSIDYPGGNVITNCHISKLVHYPSAVPPVERKQQERKWKFPVVNLYKLLQFVMWFTL